MIPGPSDVEVNIGLCVTDASGLRADALLAQAIAQLLRDEKDQARDSLIMLCGELSMKAAALEEALEQLRPLSGDRARPTVDACIASCAEVAEITRVHGEESAP